MSSTIDVSDEIQGFITDLIAKYNWEPVSEIKYYEGSNLGDGYACKHIAVEIIRKNDTIRLFIKYPAGIKLPEGDSDIDKLYLNEVYFYTTIFKTYQNFLGEKGLKSDLVSVPKCYGSSADNTIALENLRDKGYTLFDRKQFMNDEHIKLVLRSFARWHGTSFAFKDQRKGDFEELAKHCGTNLWNGQNNDSAILKMYTGIVEGCLAKFDQVKDKHLLERCTIEVLQDSLKEFGCNQDEYAVITKGDCWCNNMMFLYEGDNPKDVMQLDWQLIEVASPVYDISYFFYSVASEESLSKLDDYLRFYHSELAEQIRKLGGDPDELYPFSILEKEWKLYSKYGFALTFMVFKIMLVNQDEVPKLEEVDFENKGNGADVFPKFDNEDEYVGRIRVLAEFLVKNDYI
ncbi:hypothetical protein MML48_2g00002816 [Holotrichia oblita]|uniref:Uncharacterized protein n=1 Tax=Holotrichia oblita TaxID=644536 RepID=A0ACB9TIG3_HOLOL|nr:hypothetical protein MML48_2g00002816 [Holotrichia oblita]